MRMPRRRYPANRKGESRAIRKRLHDARAWAIALQRLVDGSRATETTLRAAQRFVCHQLSALTRREAR